MYTCTKCKNINIYIHITYYTNVNECIIISSIIPEYCCCDTHSHLSPPCVSLLPVWLISLSLSLSVTCHYLVSLCSLSGWYQTLPINTPHTPHSPLSLTSLHWFSNIMILILTRHTQSHTHITRPAQWHFAPSLLCSAVVIVIRHFISLHFSKYSESAAATFYCIAFIVLCVLLSRLFMICKQSSFTT